MATTAQILANRANALLSTGPRTGEGKATSKHNAVRHGLTSAAVVLPNESQEEFQTFQDNLIRDLAPETDHEHALAVVVAEAFWRRQRFYRVEAALFTARINQNPDAGDEALVQLFTDPAEMTRARLLLRYVTAAERAYRNAVADFDKAKAARQTGEAEEEEALPEIGFVSQLEISGHPGASAPAVPEMQKAAGPLPGTSGFSTTGLNATD